MRTGKWFKRVLAAVLALTAVLFAAGCTPVAQDMLGKAFGTTEGNIYENRRFLLGCELPENWISATEEERLAMIGLVTDTANSEDLEKLLERSGTWCDMYAHTEDDSRRITVMVEIAAVFNRMAYTENDLANGSEKSLPGTLESMGMSNIQVERGSKKIGGSNREYVLVSGDNGESAIYMEVFYIKSNKFYACVTLAALGENTIPEMEAMFYETKAFAP